MISRTLPIGKVCLIMLTVLLAQSCSDQANQGIDENAKKLVIMKYSHIANVRSFQATIGASAAQLVGVDNGSFWAVFEICSLDVQGSTLTGINYDAGKFFIDTGSATYGSATPGNVNV